MTYRAVIFDFDGTLADTFPWFASVLNEVADRYRFRKASADDLPRLRSLSARRILEELQVPAWKVPFIARHMRGLAARDVAQLRPFEGVPAMLATLHREGIILAIASSNAEATIRSVLGDATAGLIRRYACGASLYGKGAKLRRLTRDLGLRPHEILSIGDEIRDAEAAREAGVDFGAVSWGYTNVEALQQLNPTFVFDAVGDIENALQSGNRGETDGNNHASFP
jgi:phosphoglycolate phosphatase